MEPLSETWWGKQEMDAILRALPPLPDPTVCRTLLTRSLVRALFRHGWTGELVRYSLTGASSYPSSLPPEFLTFNRQTRNALGESPSRLLETFADPHYARIDRELSLPAKWFERGDAPLSGLDTMMQARVDAWRLHCAAPQVAIHGRAARL